jgi:alkanesulfonate monooxygenase SsuD/methylene tetrahydromethanopterin reductase-like flavin-dependent oxidoreductase (luciferase family)
VSDDLTRALAVVGTPVECAARLRELWSAGVDTLMFPLAGRNRVGLWRTIRDEVLAQIIV